MTTELLDAPQSAVAEYQPFYAQLVQLEQDNAALVFDYESKKGNKEARSHVNSLRLTKGALERTRKAAKEESLRIGRAIDSEAKEISARIDAMITVHQAKLDEIEQREKDRVAGLQSRLSAVVNHGADAVKSDEFKQAIFSLETVAIDDSWQELTADVAKAKDARLVELRAMLAEAEKYEAEQAELARLRAEAEARAQKEREEAIAKAAAEKARAEAQRAIEEAERKAQAEREAAARRELELKLQAEQAERRRIEAEKKAEQDRKDALAKAEADKQRAIQAEKDRVAAIAKAEAEAQAKREADKAHRAKVNRAALAAMIEGGIAEACAKECIKLIAQGKIPAVQITY